VALAVASPLAAACAAACLPACLARGYQVTALLSRVLSEELLSAVTGRPLAAPVSLLYSGAPGKRQNKHMLFVVEAGARHPFALVKWARRAAIEGLEREQRALKSVRDLGDPVLTSSCPPCWGPFDVGNEAAILVQRFLPAQPAYAQLRASVWPRFYVVRHFDRVIGWLTHFSAATGSIPWPFDESMLQEHIEQPLLTAAVRFGEPAVPTTAVEAVCGTARTYLGRTVRLVAEHGDLWVANLLFSRSRLYVVDWEHFAAEAMPGFDLLLFCLTYAMHFPWRPFGWEPEDVAFSRAFLKRTWLTEHIETFLTRGCIAAGLPPGLVPVMLPVVLARMAVRQSEHSISGLTPARSWLRMLQTWWDRPADNWLEQWAHSAQA
jgi:hypothetical protein